MKALAITGGILLTIGLIFAVMPADDMLSVFLLNENPSMPYRKRLEGISILKGISIGVAVLGTTLLLTGVIPSRKANSSASDRNG